MESWLKTGYPLKKETQEHPARCAQLSVQASGVERHHGSSPTGSAPWRRAGTGGLPDRGDSIIGGAGKSGHAYMEEERTQGGQSLLTIAQVKVEHTNAQGGNAQSVFKPIDHSAAPAVLPTCGAFEPHEWKRNVCRNCFGTRLAHELLPPSEPLTPRDSNAEQSRVKRHDRRTIRVPHFETFENMHIIMGRHPRAPSPRGQAKAQHKPVTTTDERNTGKMNECEEEETHRLTEIESRLREAWQKISQLKAKLARKHKRLQEAESAGYTLRVRMDALLKEAAELERAEKQLRLDHAEAWKREKEFWIQEVQMAKKEASSWKAIAEQHVRLFQGIRTLLNENSNYNLSSVKCWSSPVVNQRVQRNLLNVPNHRTLHA